MRTQVSGFFALVLGLSALATGCSGGGSSSGTLSSLTLAVTDAASDELESFVVEITSVQLTRASGGVVSVLPDPIPVDFATLEDLSRVLNVTNVPPGLYTQASVTLDLTSADVYLVGKSAAATVLDGDGNPITGPIMLPIDLGNALNAVVDRNHLLELDFDLNQSVAVDSAANTVFVEPSLVVRVDRSDPKELGLGGELRGIDQSAGSFVMAIDSGPSPALLITVDVGANTVYQIDGMPSKGLTGLTALAALPANTWVQAFGAVDPTTAAVDAVTVEAGTGTYNGGTDIVEGHIIGRSGAAGSNPTLMVLGHSNNSTHTVFLFNHTFTVSADFLNTKVVRRGSEAPYDTDDLNVGQLVRIFGVLSGDNLDATGVSDVIRLVPTRVLGFANGAPAAGTLAVDLTRVDLRLESAFTWSEGGTTPPDPADLQLAIAGLGFGLGITAGTPVEATGFFSAVDEPLPRDFVASSLVNREVSTSLVAIHDRTGGFTLTTTFAAGEISFVVAGSAGIAEFAVLDQGFVGVTPLPSVPDPRVTQANQSGLGYYSLRDRVTGTAAVYLLFDDFAQALDQALGQGAVIYNFGAVGTYDLPTNTIAAGVTGVVLN